MPIPIRNKQDLFDHLTWLKDKNYFLYTHWLEYRIDEEAFNKLDTETLVNLINEAASKELVHPPLEYIADES